MQDTTYFIDKDRVIAYLRLIAEREELPIEVLSEYPSVDDRVSYGIYVNSINSVDRTPYKLGIQPCGSIYIVTDQLQILYVSVQNDRQAPAMIDAIQSLAGDTAFWNGYHEVDYTQDVTIGARSQIRTYTFSLKRIDFNTA